MKLYHLLASRNVILSFEDESEALSVLDALRSSTKAQDSLFQNGEYQSAQYLASYRKNLIESLGGRFTLARIGLDVVL